MKTLLLLLLISVNSLAADRYWVGGSGGWTQTGPTGWSTTSGGANNASVPTTSDAVIFDAGSGSVNCTITSGASALSLTMTSGYTGTLTVNAALNVTNDVTLGANCTIAGTAALNLSSTATLTSNGKTWTGSISLFGSNITRTLADNWTVNGSFVLNTGIATATFNGNTLTIAGGLNLSSDVASTLAGTTVINLTGGSISNNGGWRNNTTINGNVTISSGSSQDYGIGTITLVSGSITHSGTLGIVSSCGFNTPGVQWNALAGNASPTITITGGTLLVNSINNNGSGAWSWAGTHGFTVGTYQNTASPGGTTSSFVAGVTYTITTALTSIGTRRGNPWTATSNHATDKAIIHLQQGATCTLMGNLTRIDASLGRSINTFGGTVTDCINVNSFTDLKTASGSFIN